MTDTVTSVSNTGKVKAVSKTDRTKQSTDSVPNLNATDQVQLTKTLESIERLSNALAEGEAVDKAKVEKIRTMIANGEYKVDAENIARKFLELEKMLDK